MADPRELCALADLPAIEVEDPDGFEWPEDQASHVERLSAISTWLVEQSDLPEDEARAYAAEIDRAAERLDKLEHAL